MKSFMEILAILLVAALFPAVRWLHRPGAGLRCAPAQLHLAADGTLRCGLGETLTVPQQLSLGWKVPVENINEKDWMALYGKKKGAALARLLDGLPSCARMETLQRLLQEGRISWIPDGVVCAPQVFPPQRGKSKSERGN